MGNAQRVIVTGAARGLGRTIADGFVAQGWEVWAADRLSVGSDAPEDRRYVELDITDDDAVKAMITEVSRDGGLHAFVNNAAIFPLSDWDELDGASVRRTVEVNLIGTTVCALSAAHAMRDAGIAGSIVNVASATVFKGLAGGVAYTASKGGVVAMTRSLALALKDVGIRVNAVAPGIMLTEGVREQMAAGPMKDRWAAAEDRSKESGMLEPEDVAELVIFLASSASKALTGQTLTADQGVAPGRF